MDRQYKKMSFLFSAYNRFFKDVNWSSIPNPNFKFIPFVYTIWKRCSFEGFVLVRSGLIIEPDNDLSKQLSWEGKFR